MSDDKGDVAVGSEDGDEMVIGGGMTLPSSNNTSSSSSSSSSFPVLPLLVCSA